MAALVFKCWIKFEPKCSMHLLLSKNMWGYSKITLIFCFELEAAAYNGECKNALESGPF